MYDRIRKDLVDSMKSQDKFRLSVIRMLKASLMNEEVALGKQNALSDDDVLNVIKREVKKRKSSIEEYSKYNKMDVVEELKKEIDILSVYLPPVLSDEELEKIVDDTIKALGVDSIKGMGLVMKEVTSKYGSQVDGSKVSALVKSKLM